ncbi:FAD-binding domain [Microlunatus ginsengisoli]|uniref:FAD-binding domain n=2 Tax=Microlunatus ginsengisoli TaxID=363863 RepID=A0ABP6ZG52_9ACTN
MRILIVGAGIAGPTLAYWLLQAGHEPTLVERAPELRRGGYLVDFWGAGFDVAERMGIVPELRRRGYAFTEGRAVGPDGRRIGSVKTSAIMGAVEKYVSIARTDLAAVIYTALQDRVDLLLDDTVARLEQDEHEVRVVFASGGERTFDLVIGADGLHSRVRRLAFGPDAGAEKYLGIVIAAYESRGYGFRDDLVALMYAEVGFQAVRVSLREDRTMFVLSVRHDGPLPPDDPAAQQALLRDRLAGAGWEVPAMLAEMSRADTFYFDAASQIRLPSWSRGRVGLVGDAAACPSFLAGQGSALAMVESYVLAAELCRSNDHRAAFARYHEMLAPLIRSKQDAAMSLGTAFAPKNRRQLFVRNAAMRMMGLPKVADLVMGRSFRDAIELPEPAAA